jgi:hypothetical protein
MIKYKVPKHSYLPLTIIRWVGKTSIYPAQIECHPDTTLDDIEEIESLEEPKKIQSFGKHHWGED